MTTTKGPLLVTGGAGYVGAFTVRELVARGERVVVLDDFSTGHPEHVPEGVELLEVNLVDRDAVRAALAGRAFDVVLHFAARCYVGESVRDPRKYWEQNVGAALNLLGACVDSGVPGFVLSSTCAVYGEPPADVLTEDLPRAPVNPYGRTKAAIEQILEDYQSAALLRSFRLRYFNAAGGAADGSLGEWHAPETHLIPLALRSAVTGKPMQVFGTDWPTPDGTCVRDYVHVEDLASAHAAAVERLREGHAGGALNLGTGRGNSVKEILDAASRVTGREAAWNPAPRRDGDPAKLVAGPGAAGDVLGFSPSRTDVDQIVGSAWAYYERHPERLGV